MNSKRISLIDRWFVGREESLAAFRSFARGEKDYKVLFIYGSGGIGKTWLLNKMMSIAQETSAPGLTVVGTLVDMYSTASHRRDGLQEQIVNLLEENHEGEAFTKFRERYDHLRMETNQAGPELTEYLQRQVDDAFLEGCRFIAKENKVILFFDTFERVQRHRIGKWIIDLSKAMPDFRLVITSREKWDGVERDVFPYALEGFTSKEAGAYFTKRGLEQSENLKKSFDTIRVLADGHPLLIELAIEWLSGDLLSDPESLSHLSKREFEEVLLAPLRELGSGFMMQPELDHDIFQTILLMAYFNHRFNASLLRRFVERGAVELQKLKPEEIIKTLENWENRFFFIKTRPDGYIQLHDEMERLVKQYLWPTFDRYDDIKPELVRIASDWYDEQIGNSNDETTREDLRAEQIIYLLDVEPEKCINRLDGLSSHSFDLNYLLVNEITPDKVLKVSTRYQYRLAANLGLRAQAIYDYEAADEYWQIALKSAEQGDIPEQQIDALLGVHSCSFQNDPEESLTILKKTLALCDRYESKRSKVLYELGFTYRQMEDINKAIESYELARGEARKHKDAILSTILNDLGYARAFKGDYLQAEYLVKGALDLRKQKLENLEKPIGIDITSDTLSKAKLEVGLSWNTLGEIHRFKGDFAAATGAYSEALSIFNEEKAYLWQARALYSLCEAHRRIAEVLYSQMRVEAGADYDRRAENNIQMCLDLCDLYRFDKEKSTALRRLGRLLHDRGLRASDLEKRVLLFQQSFKNLSAGYQIAIEGHHTLEELEVLTELAFLVDDQLEAFALQGRLTEKEKEENRNEIELFRKSIGVHKADITKIHEMPVFEHLLEMEEGAYCYVTGDLENALDYYLKGYKGLAMEQGYGAARFRQHLGHLFKRLEQLKDAELEKNWCEQFIREWESTKVKRGGRKITLAEIYPDFVERINSYLDIAFIFRD